jgi:hypothetical protein
MIGIYGLIVALLLVTTAQKDVTPCLYSAGAV